MKKLLKKYSSLLLLCLLIHPAGVLAAPPLQTAKKRIVKTYTDLKNERLVINNQYGDVVVKTWHQQKIMVVVTLSAHAKTQLAANRLLERVSIDAGRNENQISLTSLIKEQIKPLPPGLTLQKKSGVTDTAGRENLLPKEGCNIRYEIFLPADVSMRIRNRFGNMTIADYSGVLDLENKFGNVKAGILTGPTKLNIEQGDIDLKHISGGNLKAKVFGSIKIGTIGGKVSGAFSSGNLLDIGLSNKADSVIIDADNVQQMNITGTTATNAGYSIKTILSKFLNKSTLQLKELTSSDRKPQSKLGVDSLATLLKNKTGVQSGSEKDIELQKKKLQITLISQLKKLREYEGINGNAKGKVSIKVAFTALNILN